MVRDRLSELNANCKDDSLCRKVFFKDIYIQTSPNKKVKDILDDADHLRGLIETLQNNVDIVKNLHNNGLSHTNPNLKNDLENRTYIVSQMIHRIRKGLKDLCKEAVQLEEFSPENLQSLNHGPAHSRIRREKFYRLMLKICAKSPSVVNGKNENDFESDDDNPNINLFVDNILEESRKAKLQLSEIQSRHNDMIKLEKSLIEIKDMFLELNYHVEKQGDQLNCVEHFAGKAIDDVEDGRFDLIKAEKKRNKYRKRKIRLFVILTIILIILFFIAIFV